MFYLAKKYNLSPLHPALVELKRLSNRVSELEKELGRPFIMESGGWLSDPEGKYLQSDDFTHDVRLKISGDFKDDLQRIDYANELARRLNNY